MTDDERIQRLTELARRVWPDQGAGVSWDPFYDVAKVINDRRTILFEMQSPRAFDALEAALLVLADDEGEAAMFSAGRRFEQAMRKCQSDPPAWVGKLASEWEQRAAKWVSMHESHHDEDECADACYAEARQVLVCADELRERARRP